MEALESALGVWLSAISIHQPLPGETIPLFNLTEPTEEFEAAVQKSEYYELLDPPDWYPARNLLWLFSYFDAAIDTLMHEADHATLAEVGTDTIEFTDLPPRESIALGAYALLIPIHFKDLVRQNRDLIIAHLLQYPWSIKPKGRDTPKAPLT